MKTEIRDLVQRAKEALENGDPQQAVESLLSAHGMCDDWETRRVLYQAAKEAEIGSVEKAETLVDVLLLDQ